MSRELNRYHPRGEVIVTAFVAGINAYIELTEREPGRLPIEFRAWGSGRAGGRPKSSSPVTTACSGT